MSIHKTKQYPFLEIYYYYYFLKNFNKFTPTSINNLFLNNLFIYFFKKKINTAVNYKKIIKNNFFEKTKFFNNRTEFEIHSFKKINPAIKNSFISEKLINLYFLFNYSLFNSNLGINANLRMFSIHSYNNNLIIFDSSKFLLR